MENRYGYGYVPLGSYATRLIQRIIYNKDTILYSERIVEELRVI